MHGYNSGEDVRADDSNRNGNIAGTLHRTIRMIYYLNEGLVDAAGQWCILSPVDRPGFAIVTINDDREFLLYYLNYYLGRYVGDEVVEVSGTCPYYEQSNIASDYGWNGQVPYDVSMPEAPTLVTRSKDGKRLYVVVANGTGNESLPCRVDLKGFRAGAAEGKRLTQSSIDAPALVEKEGDVMSALPVKLENGGAALTFEAAAHSVSFIALTAAQ
jgi:alpha-L-arabinofuranosidase